MNIRKVDVLMSEIRENKELLDLAWQDLDYAEDRYVKTAILKIKALEERHNELCRELKNTVFEPKKEENKFKEFYKKVLIFIK